MLKWENRTNLHAVQYKWHPGSVLMFCPYYFRNGKFRHLVLIFCGTASLDLYLACSQIFCQNQGFCSYKIALIKKRNVNMFWTYSWSLILFLLIIETKKWYQSSSNAHECNLMEKKTTLIEDLNKMYFIVS